MSEKVYMLNALWFKEDGGAEKYSEYGAAAAPFVQALGGRMVEGYQPREAIIGSWDPDVFFMVEWPDWESFKKLGEDEGYRKIAHLRDEALHKSLLIRCDKVG